MSATSVTPVPDLASAAKCAGVGCTRREAHRGQFFRCDCDGVAFCSGKCCTTALYAHYKTCATPPARLVCFADGCTALEAHARQFARCGACDAAAYCSPKCKTADEKTHTSVCSCLRSPPATFCEAQIKLEKFREFVEGGSKLQWIADNAKHMLAASGRGTCCVKINEAENDTLVAYEAVFDNAAYISEKSEDLRRPALNWVRSVVSKYAPETEFAITYVVSVGGNAVDNIILPVVYTLADLKPVSRADLDAPGRRPAAV